MQKNRLEAFSDGVLAIIITIMVLELKVPKGADWATLSTIFPVFLSFLYVAIYWNNHHHLLHTVTHASAAVLWANLNLLFWLSLIPVHPPGPDRTNWHHSQQPSTVPYCC